MLFVVFDNRLTFGYRVEFACVVLSAEKSRQISIQSFALPAVFGRQPILVNYAMHLVPRPPQFGSGYRAERSAVLVRSYIVSAVWALVELSIIQVLSVWVYTIAEHRYALHFFIATYAKYLLAHC